MKDKENISKKSDKSATTADKGKKAPSTPEKAKLARKKRLVTVLIIVFLCFVVLLIANRCIDQKNKEKNLPTVKEEKNNELIDRNFRNYYKADWDADLSRDSEYMEKNRLIMYTGANGAQYAIDDIPKEQLHEGHLFFQKYFDTIISGNYEEYPDLFVKKYRDNPVGFEKNVERSFPPQRIYDITVKELSRTFGSQGSYNYDGQDCEYGYYVVEFKILKNDAHFRRDLAENASRPLIYELVTFNAGTKDEKTYIRNLYTEETALENGKQNVLENNPK